MSKGQIAPEPTLAERMREMQDTMNRMLVAIKIIINNQNRKRYE